MLSRNTMSFVESKDRMMAKLRQKSAAIGHSGDLNIADFRLLDEDNAVLLLEYEKDLGPVNGENIRNFVSRTFDGQLYAQTATAKVYPEFGGMSVIVSRVNDTRHYSEHKNMVVVVANTMFLDEDMGETWEVSSDSEGNKCLTRVREDSIKDIIESRKNRMMVKSSHLTFANALSAQIPGLMPGDEVKYYKDGQNFVGIVDAVSKNSITLTSPDGKDKATVSPEAIIELIARGPEWEEKNEDYLIDMVKKMYGMDDELAKKFVNP